MAPVWPEVYPVPTVVLFTDTDLARTGIPVASLLLVATGLILAGLLLVRGAARARPREA